MVRYVSAVLLAATLGAGCSSPATKVKHADKAHTKAASQSLLADAREDVKNNEYDAADAKYGQAYEEKKSFDILEERVDFLIHAGRASKAVEVSKAYYDGNVSDVKGVGLYTEALIAAGQGSLAIVSADEMLQFSDDAAGHDKKGRALLLIDKDDEALVELRKAVSLDKASAAYHESLGQALLKAGKIDEAALEFRAALKTSSGDADAHVLLGSALRAQGELDEAKRELDRAIQLDGRSGKAYFELGLLLNAQSKQPEAEVALSKAVQLAPNESRFWYAYGEIFRLSQRDDDALNAYQKAADLDPPYGKAMTKLGTMLIKRKQLDKAEEVLKNAVLREPKTAANYLPLGVLYATKRQPKPAIENYELFLKYAPKNDPDRDRVKEAISQLRH